MKNISNKRVGLFCSFIVPMLLVFHSVKAQPGGSISFETFYEELAPYGSWVQHRTHGYVWLPDVPGDFQPYATDGHWIMTEYGNMWVSDFVWGWAAFHYGRWFFDDNYGWAWVPGNEWGPAWVAWRSGGGYYGWAPLGPNIMINVNIGNYIPDYSWVFVKQRYFCQPRVYRYCVPRRRVNYIVHQTTIINNTYVYNDQPVYYTGPKVVEVERVTRQRVPVYHVERAERPGRGVVRNDAVSVYRPTVRTARSGAAPSRVVNGADVRTSRSASSRPDASNNTSSGVGRSRVSRSSNEEATERSRSTATNPARSRSGNDYSSTPRSSRSRSGISREHNTSSRSNSSARENDANENYTIEPRQSRSTYSPSEPARNTAPRSTERRERSYDVQDNSWSRPSGRSEQPSRSSAPAFSESPTRSSAPTRSDAPSRENNRSFSEPSPSPSIRQSEPSRSTYEPSRSSSPQESAPASRPSGGRGSGRPTRD